MLLGRRRLLLRRAATEVNRSIFQKQTLERPSSNGGRGSQVAVGRPRVDFITGKAGIGQLVRMVSTS
jgi:hypothetical protein